MNTFDRNMNLELIRLNDASIVAMQAGYSTQTRDTKSPNFRDDTVETIAQLTEYNAELRAPNRILEG
jgi:hypothetical protein